MTHLKRLKLRLDPPIVLDVIGYEHLIERISEEMADFQKVPLQATSLVLELEVAKESDEGYSEKEDE